MTLVQNILCLLCQIQEHVQVSKAALALFRFGQEEAERHGLLLVDTKYEFGKSADGRILLIDEIHTPDSSRRVQCLAIP